MIRKQFSNVHKSLSISVAVVSAMGSSLAMAQSDGGLRDTLEEVVVTGSYIKGSPTDAPSPVKVIDQEQLTATGSPTVVELVANLGVSSGTENQSNQFASNFTTGTANINLRGLGLSRTLVLMNSRRMVLSPFPSNSGEAFVDINTIPALAIERVEVLKDGAAATYGSDAVAGVANFITRSEFEGFEVSGSYQDIQDSNGDWDVGAIWGLAGENYHWVTSVGYKERSELSNMDKLDLVEPVPDVLISGVIPLPLYGQSTIGNPGAFVGLDGTGSVATGLVQDPDCLAAGGTVTGIPDDNRCGFVYIPFSNLIEKEERIQFFSEVGLDVNEHLELSASILYSDLDVPEWKSSPSYPPVIPVDPSRYVPPYHPALAGFITDTGQVQADFAGGAIFVGRPVGVTGPAAEGFREQETLRIVIGAEGLLGGITYDTSLMYSEAEATVSSPDTVISRYSNALRGFGGPNCTLTPTGNLAVDAAASAGDSNCLFYNPFSSAIPGSPGHVETLENDPSVLSYMEDQVIGTNTSDLMVFDLVFTGEGFRASGGVTQWAGGLQYRDETLEIRYGDLANIDINPGVVVGNDRPGIFTFLRGGTEGDFDQDTWALFGELNVPFAENLEVQFALRYEDYGGNIGSSLDPKMAGRWRINDFIVFRGSASTTFRAPSLNQTALDSTALELIGRELAFKAVDRKGNPDLDPEEAVTFNIGVILTPVDGLELSADYWRFDFSDPVVREDPNGLVNQAATALGDPCLSDRVSCSGTSISRIETTYVNGPDIETSGIDFSGSYNFDALAGLMTVGVDINWIEKYEVGAFLGEGSFDAVGRLNAGTFVRPLPEWRLNTYLNYNLEHHNVRFIVRYIDDYVDDGVAILKGSSLEPFIEEKTVDDHTTADIHYVFSFNEDNTSLSASIINITDEDPPAVRSDLRYDSSTHNPFGRMFKLSVKHKFSF